MAKAVFHRNQRVWVEPVGTWATIDRVVPVWAKGFDEPVRVTYDLGLGREFLAHELRAEQTAEATNLGDWRILRARNKWQAPEDCPHHPVPGTFPVVVTDANDWGGWRVPGAEYDRDPRKIELQARLLAASPRLFKLAQELTALVSEDPEAMPAEVVALARKAGSLLRTVAAEPAPSEGGADPAAVAAE